MGKKGRRGRAKKGQTRSASAAPVSLDESPATLPSAGIVTPAPAEAETPQRVSSEPSAELSPEPPRAPSGDDSEREPAPPEESVPPAGDLDARFFAESPSEAWLAHELELRDPRFMRKMTANVAQRRAHLSRYVVGVVGVAVALCLAALIKSAVPAGDDESRAHPASPMAMPAARPSPLPLPAAAPDEPAATPDGSDGGG